MITQLELVESLIDELIRLKTAEQLLRKVQLNADNTNIIRIDLFNEIESFFVDQKAKRFS